MMKQGAIEAGYINFGYFSPETSSNDEYPCYIKENVSESIKKIQSYQNEQSVTFAFMTDIHYSKTTVHDLRMKRLINAYKDIKNNIGTDMLILGGDYANNGNKEYNRNNYIGLKEHLSGLKYFPVNGNHDDNSMWDEYIDNEKAVNHHTTQEMNNLFYNHLSELGAKKDCENSLYYYYDDNDLNVRYIFLDTNDIPEIYTETGVPKYTKQHTFAVSQVQTDWLINSALKTPDYMDIVIIAHIPPYPSSAKELSKDGCTDPKYLEVKNLVFLNDIFEAYNKKTSVSGKYCEGVFEVSVNADFSSYTGNIIGVFGGHQHEDIVETSDSGIPYVYTDCAAMYKYSTPRIDGDKSELLFDVVTIDRKNKKIYTTRIGAGNDRII